MSVQCAAHELPKQVSGQCARSQAGLAVACQCDMTWGDATQHCVQQSMPAASVADALRPAPRRPVADAIPVPLGGLREAVASARAQPWAASLPTPNALLTRCTPSWHAAPPQLARAMQAGCTPSACPLTMPCS